MLGLMYLLEYLWKIVGMNEAQHEAPHDDEALCQREKDEDKEIKWNDSNNEEIMVEK